MKAEAVTTCAHSDHHIVEGLPMFEGMKRKHLSGAGLPGHGSHQGAFRPDGLSPQPLSCRYPFKTPRSQAGPGLILL